MHRCIAVLCFYLFAQFARADFDHAMALYQTQDYSNAFAELETLAKGGDHAAQFNLGVMYYKGQHVRRDLANGYAWMVLATQGGDPQWSTMRDKVYDAFDDTEKQKADKARREVSAQYSDATLKGESGVVILKALFLGSATESLMFAMIDSDNRFSVKYGVVGPAPDVYVLHVKPGRYYLRTLGVGYMNVTNTPLEQPKNLADTILVVSGGVTYIGDWSTSEPHTNDPMKARFDVNIDYSNSAPIRAAQLAPELRKLPLFLSKAGAPLVPMTWE